MTEEDFINEIETQLANKVHEVINDITQFERSDAAERRNTLIEIAQTCFGAYQWLKHREYDVEYADIIMGMSINIERLTGVQIAREEWQSIAEEMLLLRVAAKSNEQEEE